MAPRKALEPRLQLKVDELFRRWLSDPGTQRALRRGLRRIQAATPDPAPTRDSASATLPRSRPSATQGLREEVPGHREKPPPLTPPPDPEVPAFYFPQGRPCPGPAPDIDVITAAVKCVFAKLPRGRAEPSDLAAIAQACHLPRYWAAPLFIVAGGARTGSISGSDLVNAWTRVLRGGHDEASRFLFLLGRPGARGLSPEDFLPVLQDIVDSHPCLSHLREEADLREAYVITVIQRIFYTARHPWSGQISCEELRRSHFLQELAQLGEGPATPPVGGIFCLPSAVVIHHAFRELGPTPDLKIDRRGLGRHWDGAINPLVIDRIFSGAVTRGYSHGSLSLEDFVWFLLSEEDKDTPTSAEYWFRLLDLDGDGALSLFELEFFYVEQARRLRAQGVEPPAFPDLACQMLDLVRPRCPGCITLGDLKRCGAAAIFFDAFVNVYKFLEREQREWAVRDAGTDPNASAWDQFVAEEYARLKAEEAESGLESPPSSPELSYHDDDEDDDDLEPL